MKTTLLLSALLLMFTTFGQVPSPDCEFAGVICNNDQIPLSTGQGATQTIPPFGSVSNPSTNPNGTNLGCLPNAEENPHWYIIDVQTAGTLEFSVADLGGSGYFDWAMWSYDASSCQNIASDNLPPVTCNMNGSPDGLTGMASVGNIPAGGNTSNFEAPISVNTGDQFIICICNSNSAMGYLTFSNLGSAGMCESTASINSFELNAKKKIVKIVDATGRVVEDKPNQLLFYIYDDGTSKKVFKTE